jgi:hypothetical protein
VSRPTGHHDFDAAAALVAALFARERSARRSLRALTAIDRAIAQRDQLHLYDGRLIPAPTLSPTEKKHTCDLPAIGAC